MKKLTIITLITGILLTIGGAEIKAFPFFDKKDEPIEKYSDDYVFPLDEYQQPASIFDYEQNNLKDTTPKQGGIEVNSQNTVEITKKIELSSDTVDFYTEINQYIAKGNAKLRIPTEKVQLNAKEIIVDFANNEIIAIGDVKLSKNELEYFGDYLKIDAQRESSFFTNPVLNYAEMTIIADNATMHANETIVKKGAATIRKNSDILLSARTFGGVLIDKIFDSKKELSNNTNNYKISAKKIIVKRVENKTDLTLKNATIYRGKHKIGYSPIFSISSDNDVNYVESTFPEIGNRSRIGSYIAPSVVLGLPNSSSIKMGPLISYDSHEEVGFGGFARLNTPKSQSTVMYSSATDKLLADIRYDITNNLKFNFVRHDYINGGWMGGLMPNYGAELVYETQNYVNQANLFLRNKFSVGLFEDNEDYRPKYSLTTVRYQWQAEAYNQKPLLNWEKYLMLGYAYQHVYNLYQTGEAFGIMRAGPRLYTDLGRFVGEITYFAGGQASQSPFMFDRYRYGKNNVRFRGQYYINKYLSLGYYASLNIGERDYEGHKLTENQIIAAVGTEDLKIRFGYDTVRNSSLVGFDMLLGSNKALVEFDEMKIIDLSAQEKDKKKKKRKKQTEL